MCAGFDLSLHFLLLRAIYSALVKRLGTELFVCCIVSSAPHSAFWDNHQGCRNGAALLNTVDVRPLLIMFVPDDSHPGSPIKDVR